LAILLIIQIVIVSLYYFYGINVYSNLKKSSSTSSSTKFTPPVVPPLDPEAQKNIYPSVPENKAYPQVFNIPQNIYSYNDAKALCTAYGARLANYEEVEEAYQKGGEWCNYGWSNGQMILFPTQTDTYEQLQKIKGHEHDCGRPGVNGGYISDSKQKFGVNCYGYKPKMTPLEEELMANTTPYPITKEDIIFEKQVEFWKKRIKDILVSPFNYTNWNKL